MSHALSKIALAFAAAAGLAGFAAPASAAAADPVPASKAALAAQKDKDDDKARSIQPEGQASVAARLSALVLDAAANAQAAGMKSDPASLSRMGALPIQLMKWGQISSPWVPGQFMDVELIGTGRSAVVGLSIASIPKTLCVKALDAFSMQTQMKSLEIDGALYEVGEKWKIKDAAALCEKMAAGPVKMWAATVPQGAPNTGTGPAPRPVGEE